MWWLGRAAIQTRKSEVTLFNEENTPEPQPLLREGCRAGWCRGVSSCSINMGMGYRGKRRRVRGRRGWRRFGKKG